MKQTAIINSEIKARCGDQEAVRQYLREHGADFKGTDHQIDTYFDVPEGRLKLRQGPIENNLIFYRRADTVRPKQTTIHILPVAPDSTIGEVLTAALGVRVIVDKQREIYFIDNVKFISTLFRASGILSKLKPSTPMANETPRNWSSNAHTTCVNLVSGLRIWWLARIVICWSVVTIFKRHRALLC